VNVRRSLAVAAAVLAAPVLSSCGVNFDAQTDQVYNPAVGVNDRDGSVDVLNALVVSGSAGSGTVVATLVNNDQEKDDSVRGIAGAGQDCSTLRSRVKLASAASRFCPEISSRSRSRSTGVRQSP
jgi:hypothetical protein